MPDLYAVLGVPRGASEDEIVRAYRKESRVRHPDRPGGSKEAFQELQQAHEVLTDPQKRAAYDATGEVPGAADGGGGPPGGGIDLSSLFGGLGGMFSGAGFPFPVGAMPGMGRAPRGPNKVHEIGIGLRDLYTGKTFKLTMKREVLCGGCGGKGGKRTEPCGACGGRGVRMRGQQMGPMIAMSQEPCGACAQTGQKILEACGSCVGKRVVERESVLDVVVEPGMQEGDRIVFPGQCSESPMYDAPGDVILVVRAASTDSEEWVRRGAELVLEVRLTLAESLLGWERRREDHPSGRVLQLAWTGGPVRDGEVLRIPGWGMPVRGGGMGDLRLVCRVEGGSGIAWSPEQLALLRQIWPDWKEPVAGEGVVVPERC